MLDGTSFPAGRFAKTNCSSITKLLTHIGMAAIKITHDASETALIAHRVAVAFRHLGRAPHANPGSSTISPIQPGNTALRGVSITYAHSCLTSHRPAKSGRF